MRSRRKIISWFMAIILCMPYVAFCGEPVTAYARDLSGYSTYEKWAYGEGDGYVYIGGYEDEAATELTIPEEIDGVPVKAIEPEAFKDITALKKIQIPNTVEYIGESAFSGCTGLEEVNIPTAVTRIGEKAFFQCSSMGNITLPEGLKLIGEYAFSECNSLTEITIPSSVELSENVGAFSFAKCDKLQTVTLEAGVEYISEGMFKDCAALSSVTIPDSVTRILDSAFAGCSGLADGFKLPNSIYIIGKDAFKCCSGLTEMIIPNSVVWIQEGAFSSCSQLERVVLSSNLQTIGMCAFSDCGALNNVVVPTGTESIHPQAFYNCSSLESICIPASVKDIYEKVFEGCHANLKVHTEAKEENAPETAIETYLKKSENAMANPIQYDYVTGEEEYVVEGDWKYKVTDNNTITIVKYLGGDQEDMTIHIPSTLGEDGYPVTEIGECAFLHRIGYGGSVYGFWKIYVPDSVTKIGDSAFNTCVGLDVWVPNSVATISSSAFSGCMSLTVYVESGADAVVTLVQERKIPYEMSATKINFSENTLTLPGYKSYTLEVTLEPAGVTNKNLKWTSSNTHAVFVSEEGENGEIYTTAPGTAIITATATNGMTGETVTASCTVTVTGEEEDEDPEPDPDPTPGTDPGDTTTPPPGGTTTIPPAGGTGTGNQGGTGTVSATEAPATQVTVPSVAKVGNFKAVAKKKALTLRWKKAKAVSGYEIQVSTKKNFKGAKTSSIKKSKDKYTVSKLKAKTKYYVRIRAYTNYTDADKKVRKAYGKWTVLNQKTK